MPVPLTIGDAADAIDVSIQKMWIKSADAANVRPSYYDKYFNVERGITDQLVKDTSLTGLGEAARIPEQSVIVGESPVQGYDRTYTQVEYGKLSSVTKHMWKFGIKKRKLEGVVDELRRACERRRERLCGDRLDQSFNTSYTVTDDGGNYSATISGGDAVAFISNAHTREDGGTNWNNRITDGTTVNMDLDYDAIKAAHRTAALVRDGKGNLMDLSLDTMVVRKGFANEFRAREILGAVRAGGKQSMPSSADNDAAGVPAFKILPLPWLDSNTAYWWMFDSSLVGPMFGLQLKESQPILLEGPNIVFKTGEVQYKATTMFDLGHNDARNFVGSQNTNTA